MTPLQQVLQTAIARISRDPQEQADDILLAEAQRQKAQRRLPWRRSLQRVARAQAILWQETPIADRLKIFARVDQEGK